MPDKMFVIVHLSGSGSFSVIAVYADKDDAKRFISENSNTYIVEAPYNP